MERSAPPALLPAAALLGGMSLAYQLPVLEVPLAAALVAAGIALGRPAGRLLAWTAAGMLAALAWGGAAAGPGHDPERPVAVVGEVAGHWRRSPGFSSAPVEVHYLRQGRAVHFEPRRIFVSLPEGAPLPPLGSRLQLRGYLRRSSGYLNRPPTPPGPWRLRVKSRRLMSLETGAGPLARLSGAVRRRVGHAYADVRAEGGGMALARTLVMGDPSRLPQAWKQGLRRTGLSHLLAVSGLHVGLVAGAILVALTSLPWRGRWLLALTAITLYLLVVGPRPSLLRAWLMGVLTAAAFLAERPPAAVSSLAWAAVLPAAARPELVADLGFQLTVAATGGLLLLAPPLAGRWHRLPRWLGRSLAATVAAQVAVLPWALPAFHLLTPLAPLLNLAAVPWTALCLALCLLWTLLALAAPALGELLIPVLDLVATPFSWLAAARWTTALAVPLQVGFGAASLLAVTAMAALLVRRGRPWRWAVRVAPLLLVLALLPRPEGGVEMVVLDVGQGDSILLRDGGRAVLVDGGGWDGGDFAASVLLPALLGEGVRRLEAVVVTHGDRDHCGGLLDLVAYLPVAQVWTPPYLPAGGCGGELMAVPSLERRVLAAGREAQVGRWRLRALHPRPGERLAGNEGSLVLMAQALGRRFLLTGDVGVATEMRLAREHGDELACHVLKVAHHGSRTSTSRRFLAAADPAWAVISVGRRNPYHHPAPEVVDRLGRQGIRVLRTDRHGRVAFRIEEGRPLGIRIGGDP